MKLSLAKIQAQNREVARLPGMGGGVFIEVLKQVRANTAAANKFRIMRELDQRRQAAQDVNALMTDQEKAQLTDCPYCGFDYGFGSSEVDADEICRVTCGYCEKSIEYKIEFVE